jgi:hypothetical protein
VASTPVKTRKKQNEENTPAICAAVSAFFLLHFPQWCSRSGLH